MVFDGVTIGFEMLDDLILEIKAGVIAADMDFHRAILSQRKTPPDKPGGVFRFYFGYALEV